MRAYKVVDISPLEGCDIWFWQRRSFLNEGWNVGFYQRPGQPLTNLWERIRPQALRVKRA